MRKGIIIFLLTAFLGCASGDEPSGTELTVSFRKTEQTIPESRTADALIIEFSSEADFDGFIEVELIANTNEYGVDFITQPAASNGFINVPVNNGATQSTIIVAPTPDADALADTILLSLIGGSDLVSIGNNSTMKVFLTESTNGGGSGGNNTGSGSCNGTNYSTGTVQCSPGLSTDELDIVTWNIENFPMQSATVAKVVDIIRNLDADIIAIQEIDEISSFNSVVSSLNGYEGVAVDVNGGIELGYIYKTAEIISFGTPKKLFNGQTSPFPREPVEVDITHANGLSAKLINIHLKCCDGSEDRRTDASNKLKSYIDTNFPNDEVIILGDWNEDFDSGSSFTNFLNDTDNYIFADLPIYNGSGADFSYPCTGASYCPSHIDHILVTDELCDNLSTTYTVRLDDCVAGYLSQVSDHRPVMISLKADD
ncbi:MAG: endonuclease/exonuclease/phosphatase family protein [Ekhidna sp.]|uniref:endonuclease/exonuclease/phosphatase family protein n=1 Tax=Ekhidna sp. TaxID=2608089 RepID=UPI0032EB2649